MGLGVLTTDELEGEVVTVFVADIEVLRLVAQGGGVYVMGGQL